MNNDKKLDIIYNDMQKRGFPVKRETIKGIAAPTADCIVSLIKQRKAIELAKTRMKGRGPVNEREHRMAGTVRTVALAHMFAHDVEQERRGVFICRDPHFSREGVQDFAEEFISTLEGISAVRRLSKISAKSAGSKVSGMCFSTLAPEVSEHNRAGEMRITLMEPEEGTVYANIAHRGLVYSVTNYGSAGEMESWEAYQESEIIFGGREPDELPLSTLDQCFSCIEELEKS